MTNAGPLYEAIRARLNLDDDFAQLRKRIHDLAVKTHDHSEDPYLDEVEKRLTAIEGTLDGLERRSGSDALASITERLNALEKPAPKPRAKSAAKTNPENGKPAVKPPIKSTAGKANGA